MQQMPPSRSRRRIFVLGPAVQGRPTFEHEERAWLTEEGAEEAATTGLHTCEGCGQLIHSDAEIFAKCFSCTGVLCAICTAVRCRDCLRVCCSRCAHRIGGGAVLCRSHFWRRGAAIMIMAIAVIAIAMLFLHLLMSFMARF